MKTILLQVEPLALTGKIALTGSKSESNRALILAALSHQKIHVENLSEAEDTVTLMKVLKQVQENQQDGTIQSLDIGPAGTAMRFLTAFLSITPGRFTLTGSERMQQRPIGILVDALRHLGARIDYSNNEGFPPLLITGQAKGLTNHKVSIDGGVSSQFLSALLLIAPCLPNGLELQIDRELTSKPYLTMTLQMLEDCGIRHHWNGNIISIEHQAFGNTKIYVEPDWSAASYWYSLLALTDSGSLFLKGLKPNSLQGDRAIADLMEPFGVKTTFQREGILLEKTAVTLQNGDLLDLKECPDLAQTLIVCAAALGKEVSFTGLHTLRIKETDRILALQTELLKFGIALHADKADEIFTLNVQKQHTKQQITESKVRIATYEDHRMAMAFAPLVTHYGQLLIEEPQVVGKSYPDFWRHLKQIGIQIKDI